MLTSSTRRPRRILLKSSTLVMNTTPPTLIASMVVEAAHRNGHRHDPSPTAPQHVPPTARRHSLPDQSATRVGGNATGERETREAPQASSDGIRGSGDRRHVNKRRSVRREGRRKDATFWNHPTRKTSVVRPTSRMATLRHLWLLHRNCRTFQIRNPTPVSSALCARKGRS